MGRPLWPDADERELERLVAEGFSASQIARRLSAYGRVYTRSAIMGKVARLDLKMARAPSSTIGICRATGSRMPRARKGRGMVAPAQDTLPVSVEQPSSVARAAETPVGGSRHHIPPEGGYAPGEALMALERHDCRWPVGTVGDRQFHFCRDKQDGNGPYCKAHRQTAKGTVSGHGWYR